MDAGNIAELNTFLVLDANATVANDGYAATTSPVTFSVDLPAGLRPLSISGTGWICKRGALRSWLAGVR
jgi:hypothetical protein